jgi:hypothetical protein
MPRIADHFVRAQIKHFEFKVARSHSLKRADKTTPQSGYYLPALLILAESFIEWPKM